MATQAAPLSPPVHPHAPTRRELAEEGGGRPALGSSNLWVGPWVGRSLEVRSDPGAVIRLQSIADLDLRVAEPSWGTSQSERGGRGPRLCVSHGSFLPLAVQASLLVTQPSPQGPVSPFTGMASPLQIHPPLTPPHTPAPVLSLRWGGESGFAQYSSLSCLLFSPEPCHLSV